MINVKRKGSTGERELCSLLTEYLGIICKRNITQTRGGGSDILDVPGWSIECKRYKEGLDSEIAAWWKQACEQAIRERRKPMLFYRFDGQRRWKVVVDLHHLRPDLFPISGRETATIFFDAACQLIRETIGESNVCE